MSRRTTLLRKKYEQILRKFDGDKNLAKSEFHEKVLYLRLAKDKNGEVCTRPRNEDKKIGVLNI